MIDKGKNKNTLREKNLSLVLQQVFNNPHTSRVEISKILNLNKSTISSLYNELQEKNFFIEEGEGDTTTVGGRKPTLISFNKDYGYVINIDIGFQKLLLMTNNMIGECINYQEVHYPQADITSILKNIETYISLRSKESQISNSLLGISISFHGIVYDNHIIDSPFLDLENIDLKQALEKTYNVPVMIENEANLTAIYIRDYIQHNDKKGILTISIHKGIGAGIIHNNSLHLGIDGRAGEIGRSIYFDEDNSLSFNTKIEDICSEDALVYQVREATGDVHLSQEDVIDILTNKSDNIDKILHKFTYNVSCVIYNAIVAFAPDQVYIDSPMIKSTPIIQEKIKANIAQLAPECSLHFLNNHSHASLYGGCSLIIHHILKLENYALNFYLK